MSFYLIFSRISLLVEHWSRYSGVVVVGGPERADWLDNVNQCCNFSAVRKTWTKCLLCTFLNDRQLASNKGSLSQKEWKIRKALTVCSNQVPARDEWYCKNEEFEIVNAISRHAFKQKVSIHFLNLNQVLQHSFADG